MLGRKSLWQRVVLCLLVISGLWMGAAQAKLKQVTAITQSEWDQDQLHFFFTRDTFSKFSKKDRKFISHHDLSQFGDDIWPKNEDGSFKELAATLQQQDYRVLYFFNDLTAASFLIKEKRWDINPVPLKDFVKLVRIIGWPTYANGQFKQVTMINPSEWDSDTHFFFDDFTMHNYLAFETAFSKFYDCCGKENRPIGGFPGWPKYDNMKDKRAIAVTRNLFFDAENTYFFTDGSRSNFHIKHKGFSGNLIETNKYQWTDPAVGWPTENPYDVSAHEIQEIVVRGAVPDEMPYTIDADGKARAPVYVWVKIRNKNTDKYVNLSDEGTANGFSLVTLYDYNKGPLPGIGSYLDIDNLNTPNFSSNWKVRRSSQEELAMVAKGLGDTDDAVMPKYFDGWNRYTYYVTSTQRDTTKTLCARVGTAPVYQYSCDNSLIGGSVIIKTNR